MNAPNCSGGRLHLRVHNTEETQPCDGQNSRRQSSGFDNGFHHSIALESPTAAQSPIPVTRSISTSWIRGAIRLSRMPHGLRMRLRERPSKVLAGRNAPGQVFGSRANNQHCDSLCHSECAQCVTIRTGPSRPETGGAMPRPRPPAAAPPGPPRPAGVERTSSSSSFESAFSALVTSQR
jgi:hypothetical protein